MNGKSARQVLKIPKYFIFGMLMTAFLALFVAPDVVAGCKNGKGKCNNPPPDNIDFPFGTSTASFDEDGNMYVEDSSLLNCNTGQDLTVANGDYFCDDPLPVFHISTASFTGQFNKKFTDICGSFGNTAELGDLNFAILKPYEFSYGWRDDCTYGSCRIEISMKFFGDQILDETKDKADQLSIVLSGTAWDYTLAEDEANPFKEHDILVDVDSATLEYGLAGKRRSVGLCPFGVDKDDKRQSVSFLSMDPYP